jgi:hypothetical protein
MSDSMIIMIFRLAESKWRDVLGDRMQLVAEKMPHATEPKLGVVAHDFAMSYANYQVQASSLHIHSRRTYLLL